MFILMLIFGAKIQNGRGWWNSLRSLYYSTESVSEKVSFSCCKQSLNIVQKCHWRTLLLAVSPDFISKKMLSCTRKKGWLRNYRRANRDFFIALLSKNVMSWAKNMASNHECPTKDRLTQCLKINPKGLILQHYEWSELCLFLIKSICIFAPKINIRLYRCNFGQF